MPSIINFDMTPQEMRQYYLDQTDQSLQEFEKDHPNFRHSPPFPIFQETSHEFIMTPEITKEIGMRWQIEQFAQEAKVSTAGVRENQNVLCSWDYRYRINEYMIAMMAMAMSRLTKELHQERLESAPKVEIAPLVQELEPCRSSIEAILGLPLEECLDYVRQHPVRMVGGEVRSNTPRYIGLMSRIYAAHQIPVLLTPDKNYGDSSSIFMWSYLTYLLGLAGADYFTSSHGAPQKQSDKILAHDGAQYLPPTYEKLVHHLYQLLEEAETKGLTIPLASMDSPFLKHTLDYQHTASLYAHYLRQGVADPHTCQQIEKAIKQGLLLKLDFFGGCGYKTIDSILKELKMEKVFHNGYLRPEEDPFFHNVGFRVAPSKKDQTLEVVHDSVDASQVKVVESAGYDQLLAQDELGQLVFNVDPDADRFVAGQVVDESALTALNELGISHLSLGEKRHFALYSPNQFFLMLAEHDRSLLAQEESTQKPFDIHTYVSALSWDEWAEHYEIPVVRVPVGFKEIAAICRQVENALDQDPKAEAITIFDGLGQEVKLQTPVRLLHAGEESGGRIGGPERSLTNLWGDQVIAMREKSAGEACISAIALAANLKLKQKDEGLEHFPYLHHYLKEIFDKAQIAHPMEFRGDIVHYNEAIFDPKALAQAKKEGILEKDRYNNFFAQLVQGASSKEVAQKLSQAMPALQDLWSSLERVDSWEDGLQFWFTKNPWEIRDLCIRPSGTDAKTKIYFDGKSKAKLEACFNDHFALFTP